MLARTPAIFLVYMESYVGAFGPSLRGCLPGCLERGQKCPQNVRSVPFLVGARRRAEDRFAPFLLAHAFAVWRSVCRGGRRRAVRGSGGNRVRRRGQQAVQEQAHKHVLAR
jgi:hypothetical protein